MHKTSMLSALALAVTAGRFGRRAGRRRTDRPARPQGTEQDGGSFRRGRGGPEGMLLKGITLSADQQQKLADLRTREREAWQKDHPRTANGQNGAEARPRREPGDTAGFAARRAEMEKRFDAAHRRGAQHPHGRSAHAVRQERRRDEGASCGERRTLRRSRREGGARSAR